MWTPTKPSLGGADSLDGGEGDDDGVIIFAGGIDAQDTILWEFPLNFEGMTSVQIAIDHVLCFMLQFLFRQHCSSFASQTLYGGPAYLQSPCYIIGGLSFVPIAAARVAVVWPVCLVCTTHYSSTVFGGGGGGDWCK